MLQTSTADDPAWALKICEEADLGSGTVHPILERLVDAGWATRYEESGKRPTRPRSGSLGSSGCAERLKGARREHGRGACRDLRRRNGGRCRGADAGTDRRIRSDLPTRRLRPEVSRSRTRVRAALADHRMGVRRRDRSRDRSRRRRVAARRARRQEVGGGTRARDHSEHGYPERPGRPSNPPARFFVAGGHRSHVREEWASVLAGDPGNGIVLSRRRRLRYALGFLWAALRMRLRDLTAPLWTPVDWLLSVETRTHAFITLAVGAQVVDTEYEDGFHTLVTEGWGWCAGCGIALRLFVGRLRRIRGIELASAHSDSNDVKHPVTTGPERSRARQSVPWTGGRQKERGLDVLLNDGTHSDSRGVKGRCHRGHRASTGSALVERRQ